MTDSCPSVDLPAFMLRVARSPRSALLLDYDGTLAPFELNRQQAVPYPGVADLLQDIMDTDCTRVVVISGRPAQELLPLLKLSPSPEVWGTHGIERLCSDGTYELAEMDHHSLEALDEADQWVDGLKLHHLIEHKPGSLALHWRGYSEEEAREIRSKVLLGWADIADRGCLRLEHFDGGIEIRIAHRNKGDAVRAILSEIGVDAPVAYLGDDDSDEDAFQALHDRGVRILVRPHWRETAADLWLRPPVQLLAFLNDWLQACKQASMARVRARSA